MKQPRKTKKKNNKYRIFLLIIAVIVGLIWPFTAAAADPIDYLHLCTLQLHIVYDGSDIEGMTYHLYRVGSGDESTSFTLTGAFAGYPVNLTNLDASGWQDAADDLTGYAEADSIPPDATDISDVNGIIDFTLLPAGLYLVVGEDYISGYSLFEVSPFLIALPHLQSDGSWLYDVTANPKVTDPRTVPGGTPGTTIPLVPLPQTGWLWWPVPLLALLGILLFSFGWWRRYHYHE